MKSENLVHNLVADQVGREGGELVVFATHVTMIDVAVVADCDHTSRTSRRGSDRRVVDS